MEVEMQSQYDDLVGLLNKNLTLSPHQPVQPPAQEVILEQPVPEERPQPIVYSSQHYTHSYHVVKASSAPPSTSQTPVNGGNDAVDATSLHPDLYAALIRNSINPSALSTAQLSLFVNADDDQKLRLLELWRIAPPVKEQEQRTEPWFGTSLHQEEMLAKLRWENAEAAKQQQQQQQEQQQSVAIDAPAQSVTCSLGAEPYMLSGYELLARREYEEQSRSTARSDPVYKTTGANMQTPSGAWMGSVTQMENQYGAYDQLREQMNAYGVQNWGAQRNGLDEEMVM